MCVILCTQCNFKQSIWVSALRSVLMQSTLLCSKTCFVAIYALSMWRRLLPKIVRGEKWQMSYVALHPLKEHSFLLLGPFFTRIYLWDLWHFSTLQGMATIEYFLFYIWLRSAIWLAGHRSTAEEVTLAGQYWNDNGNPICIWYAWQAIKSQKTYHGLAK